MSKGQELVCNGAICICDKGTKPGKLKVTSQNKDHVQDKLIATTQDKTFSQRFGSCKMMKNAPCKPTLMKWKGYYKDIHIVKEGNLPLLEKSTVKCAIGGNIRIKNTLQIEIPGTPTQHNIEQIRAAFKTMAPIVLNPSKLKK
jgi:hypothetical protein